MSYATFIGALTDAVATLHDGHGDPFSMVNGFTIGEVCVYPHTYEVQGEAWTFYLRHTQDEGWQVLQEA